MFQPSTKTCWSNCFVTMASPTSPRLPSWACLTMAMDIKEAVQSVTKRTADILHLVGRAPTAFAEFPPSRTAILIPTGWLNLARLESPCPACCPAMFSAVSSIPKCREHVQLTVALNRRVYQNWICTSVGMSGSCENQEAVSNFWHNLQLIGRISYINVLALHPNTQVFAMGRGQCQMRSRSR